MGVQIPHRVHSQMPDEDVIRADTTASWEVFHKLAAQKERPIEKGHLQPDHVHMLISILPKYAVSRVVGMLTFWDD